MTWAQVGQELVRAQEYYTPINVLTKGDRKVIFALDQGHGNTVFTRSGDTLFVADYSPIATGCEVVALDLTPDELTGVTPKGAQMFNTLLCP